MTALCFVDTNVFVYAVDDRDLGKQEQARAALRERVDDIVISSQVCAEYFRVVVERLGVPVEEARDGTAWIARFPSIPIDPELVLEAVALVVNPGLSIWDAMIVRAAARAGCATLLTEDLHAGTTIDGVEVVNPFATLS